MRKVWSSTVVGEKTDPATDRARTLFSAMRYESKVPPTLEEAQAFVGGLVELVMLSDGSQMLVNEEGLLKELPYNPEATRLYQMGRQTSQLIVGNALVLSDTARWS